MDNDAPPPGNPTVESAPAETLTRAEHEAAVKAARDAAWADARRTFDAKAKEAAKQAKEPKPDAPQTPPGDPRRLLAQRDALDDALAGRSVTADQRRVLRDLIARVDPDNPAEWAAQTVSTFLGSGATSQTTTPDAPRVIQNSSDGGAPQGLPVWERPGDPFKWTSEDVKRLEALKGKREAHHILRRKAEEYARDLRLAVPSRRAP